MALSIKDEETDRLARELAQRNGETVTMAVKVAVKERLERQEPNPKAGLADWLMKISEETGPMMNDGRTSKELMDELYDDDTGLPK
ncbi:MAG: type II toxin-antitoxin system VapB family antitoxin [Terracidiphilus sp.]|jgi:antitoxin VapB